MTDAPPRVEIKPQKGPQEAFLSTKADIAFYGGAAGGGKSFALMLEPLRHMMNPNFRGVIFRRETPQITNPGGLWDEITKIYPLFGLKPNRQSLSWSNPETDADILKLAHLQHESDVSNWQGSQITFIGFDEVTHFTEHQFFYMFSRNRSMAGVPGYIRATCNPDPDSWVAEFLSWWIDQDTGFPIPERAGVLRYMIRSGDEIIWGNSRKELLKLQSDLPENERLIPKSVTFIPAKVTDNKILLETDPAYLANLRAMSRVDRARLEGGNWKVRVTAGEMFRKEWFEIVDAIPADIKRRIRYWDRAATEPHEGNKNPDWTVGLKMVVDAYGVFYVEDVCRIRARPLKVKQTVKAIASHDTVKTKIGIEKDPGQAGESEVDDLIRSLAGYITEAYKVTTAKEIRAKPVSAQSEAGNIKILKGPWNAAFLAELEAFPTDSAKDDQVDAFSGAFNALTGSRMTLDSMTRM
jgi:predicted phage terminase large subunit-like protein